MATRILNNLFLPAALLLLGSVTASGFELSTTEGTANHATYGDPEKEKDEPATVEEDAEEKDSEEAALHEEGGGGMSAEQEEEEDDGKESEDDKPPPPPPPHQLSQSNTG